MIKIYPKWSLAHDHDKYEPRQKDEVSTLSLINLLRIKRKSDCFDQDRHEREITRNANPLRRGAHRGVRVSVVFRRVRRETGSEQITE